MTNPFQHDRLVRALSSTWVYLIFAAGLSAFTAIDLDEHHYLTGVITGLYALTVLAFAATRRAARLRAEYDGRRAVLDSAHDVGIDTEYGEWEDWYLLERVKAARALVEGMGESRFRK